MATSVCEGQNPQRPHGQYTCINHKGRQLDIYCKTCEVPACIKCISSTHAGHLLCELSEFTSEKKQDLRSFINKTENVDLVEIDEYINSVNHSLRKNISCFEKLSEQLKTQTAKLKEELDHLLEGTLSVYQLVEENNAKLLHTYKHDLEMYSEQLKQKVEECKKLLQRGSDIQIYDEDFGVTFSVLFPVEPTLAIISLTPNRHPGMYLKQALGEMELLYKCQSHAHSGCDLRVGLTEEEGPPDHRQTSALESGADDTEEEMCKKCYYLLPETKVQREWISPYPIASACPTDSRLWTCYEFNDTLTLIDKEGKIVQEVKHNTTITDICLSPTTNRLWSCDRNNNILELKSGRIKTRFSTSTKPLSICVTASEHVIIGMYYKLSKFARRGELVQTTVETEGQFVTCPWRISECPVTHNIDVVNYMCDVVILNNDLHKLFVYRGAIPNVFTPTTENKSFYPVAVVYDSMGNLVIGDRINKHLLLISGRGQFIRIIHTDHYKTYAVGIDREGELWSVFNLNNVKLLKYNYTDTSKCVLL